MTYSYDRLTHDDLEKLRAINTLFSDAFEDSAAYLGNPPSDEYLLSRLSDPTCIIIAAYADDDVIAGVLTAYTLRKLEQERSEVYLYDLAVSEDHRRHGVATGLIDELKRVARDIGAYVIFVQADAPDTETRAFYRSLGATEEDVRHYDILP